MRIARLDRKPCGKAPRRRPGAPGNGEKRPALFPWAVLAALALALASGAAFAAMRSSAHYAMSLDAIAASGGPSSSGSYRQPDSAFGEEAAGPGSGASYRGRAGAVMPWGAGTSAARHWPRY